LSEKAIRRSGKPRTGQGLQVPAVNDGPLVERREFCPLELQPAAAGREIALRS